MTTQPSRRSPGGTVVLHIDRLPGADPNSAKYSVSFRDQRAMGDTLLGKVHGLDALRAFLRKLNFTGPAAQTACAIVTERLSHEIAGVILTPALIRELGL